MSVEGLEVLVGYPVWVPVAALALLVGVAGLVWWGLRRSVWLSGIGPQAVVALGGVAVSVHGLWGFATETAHLPFLLRVGFIAVFDMAELVLLVGLYRSADPEVGWTPQLRLMHRTTWLLVAFSGAMNAVHAPNWWARPVLAAVPALAAWLIELQLRGKMHTPAGDHEEEAGRPGPIRLLALVWQHTWAAVFAALGLDARGSGNAIARAALVQRAAHEVYHLRQALERRDEAKTPGTTARAKKRAGRKVETFRTRAQRALDRADVATDTQQSLALARRLAALTRADDVAQLDFADPRAVMTLLDDLSVLPSAQRLNATTQAEEAQAAREEAESARRAAEEKAERAEAARQEAEAARRRAEEETRRAEEETRRADNARLHAVEETRRAESARQEAEAARRRAEVDAERDRAVEASWGGHRAVGRVSREPVAADIAQRGVVAARLPKIEETQKDEETAEVPPFKSEAKARGWTYYREQVSAGHPEPSAGALAERFGVNEGNARNWLRAFRTAAHDGA